MFKNCGNLKSVTLPQGVELIGEMCFCKCGLESIRFPSSVEEIQQEAFYGNRLRAIAFENGSLLREVGDCAFGRNSDLKREDVVFPRDGHVSENAFRDDILQFIKF